MASIGASVKRFFISLWSKVSSFFSRIYNFWFKPPPPPTVYSINEDFYVNEIAEALTNPISTNIKNDYHQFIADVPRYHDVIINDLSVSGNNDLVIEKVLTSIDNIATTAQQKFPWVTKEKLLPMITKLTQAIAGTVLEFIKNNYNLYSGRTNLISMERNIYRGDILIISDTKCSLGMDFGIMVGEDENEITDLGEFNENDEKFINHSIKIKTLTTIDFSKLGAQDRTIDEGCITQQITMLPPNSKITITPKTDSIATIHHKATQQPENIAAVPGNTYSERVRKFFFPSAVPTASNTKTENQIPQPHTNSRPTSKKD